jgi:hypothetical protein
MIFWLTNELQDATKTEPISKDWKASARGCSGSWIIAVKTVIAAVRESAETREGQP